ncbi:MAG: ferredoxin [Pseudomonadota bacterium]
MTFAAIERAVQAQGLDVIGVVDDQIVLLGPGKGFWQLFQSAPEYQDGQNDPVDRWSRRVIGDLAGQFDAAPEFPFGGPPYAPFLDWALKTGRAWQSPVGMLVHDQMGLMVSYRGALRFENALDVPRTGAEKPCQSCSAKPCLTSCPVNALNAEGYDTDACAAYLRSDEGAVCMNGCLVRRACPYSGGVHRDPAQSRLHMRSFLEGR